MCLLANTDERRERIIRYLMRPATDGPGKVYTREEAEAAADWAMAMTDSLIYTRDIFKQAIQDRDPGDEE